MDKPNILFLISHDTGKYLGCYGRQVKTPHLDALASRSVRLSRYFCPAPQCSPSRGSILTGKYPHNHGMMGLTQLGFALSKESVTLPGILRQSGYETVLIAGNHENVQGAGGSKDALGYDCHIPLPPNVQFHSPSVADAVEKFLREKSAEQQHRPYYASVGFFDTHRPYDQYDTDPEIEIPPFLPDTPNVREDMARFHESLKTLDQAIGKIVDVLEETGQANNTVLIYTTDHGIAFPRAKGTLRDSGLETAMLIYGKNRFPAGDVYDDLLCNVDLMPTLLELAGANVPDDLDGRSFLPLLENRSYTPRDHFFCELTWHCRYHPMRGIRTDRYKFIRNFEEGPAVYMPFDVHDSLSGQEVREKFYIPNTPEELYDLHEDPLELENLADDESHKDVLAGLRTRVEQWMRETEDPLLNGKVPGVTGAKWRKEIEEGRGYRDWRPE